MCVCNERTHISGQKVGDLRENLLTYLYKCLYIERERDNKMLNGMNQFNANSKMYIFAVFYTPACMRVGAFEC